MLDESDPMGEVEPMSPNMAWVVIVAVLSLLLYLFMGVNVARARATCKIPAPAMAGHPEFERALRVQMNTLEWLPVYLVSLGLFAVYVEPRLAAALGVVWILGRTLYMRGYMQAAAKRGPGFLVQAGATFALLLGGVAGAILKLTTTG
jgi:glutathione S-transferase